MTIVLCEKNMIREVHDSMKDLKIRLTEYRTSDRPQPKGYVLPVFDVTCVDHSYVNECKNMARYVYLAVYV